MDNFKLGAFEVVIMRLFYSKAADLCQFFPGMKFLVWCKEILCYN